MLCFESSGGAGSCALTLQSLDVRSAGMLAAYMTALWCLAQASCIGMVR